MCNKDFIRAVVSGKKKMLKLKDVRFICVPKYDELSIKNIFHQFRQYPEVMLYLPDEYPAGRGPNKEFFWNIVNTLDGNYVS